MRTLSFSDSLYLLCSCPSIRSLQRFLCLDEFKAYAEKCPEYARLFKTYQELKEKDTNTPAPQTDTPGPQPDHDQPSTSQADTSPASKPKTE